MKKTVCLGLVVAMFFGISCATAAVAEENPTPDITVTLSSKVWSQYLGANAGVINKSPIAPVELFVLFPKIGLYFDYWQSMGLDDFPRISSNGGDEIDWTVGWSGTIYKRFSLDLGVAYYDTVKLFNSKGDVIAPYVEADLNFDIAKGQTLTPFVRFEMNLPVNGHEPKSGLYTYAGLKHSWQLTERLSINHKAGLMYDSGAYGADSSIVGQYDGGLSYKISKLLSVEPLAIKLRMPVTSMNDGRKTEVAIGAGITLHF